MNIKRIPMRDAFMYVLLVAVVALLIHSAWEAISTAMFRALEGMQ